MSHDLPIAGDTARVPVYTCHVIIHGPDEDGWLHGRVANLPMIVARAKDERSLLLQLVKLFKERLVAYHSAGEVIEWSTVERPEAHERQRWIPVHL